MPEEVSASESASEINTGQLLAMMGFAAHLV
jgi:hypothetical protein